MNENIQRCNKCILPLEYPGVSFDENGTCNYCHKWDKKWENVDYRNQSSLLEKILTKYRNKSKPYDCLIGLSGGKDSCYAAYILKKQGMNPLACTFDNGFMTERALHNIKHTVEALSIDHIFVEKNSAQLTKFYKHFITTTGEFCSVCNTGIQAAVYSTAKNYDIKLIVSGTSPRTEADCPKEYFTCSPRYFNKVSKGTFPRKMVKSYIYISKLKRAVSHLRKSPFYLQLPNYIPWNEEEFINILENKLNWQGTFGEQHTDCFMSDAKEYLKLKQFGVIELTTKLSSLIRDKQISRDNALSISQQHMDYLIANEAIIRTQLKSQFNLSEIDLNKAIQKSHVDYLSKVDNLLAKVKDMYEILHFKKKSSPAYLIKKEDKTT